MSLWTVITQLGTIEDRHNQAVTIEEIDNWKSETLQVAALERKRLVGPWGMPPKHPVVVRSP